MAKGRTTQERREVACRKPLRRSRAIIRENGAGESSLATNSELPVTLAERGESLVPNADFPVPDAQARNHVLALEDGNGMGLYHEAAWPGRGRQ